ncbi:phage tail assembly chaperone [Burkholderia sp. JPY481]
MLTVDQLGYLLKQAYPNLKRGVHYHVAHPVDSVTLEQTGPAFIASWQHETIAQPILDDIERLWQQHGEACSKWDAERKARLKRDELLVEADRLVEGAIDRGDAEKEKSARHYRQALRDIPQQTGFPFSIEWPERPS